jgi:hypothetical protein
MANVTKARPTKRRLPSRPRKSDFTNSRTVRLALPPEFILLCERQDTTPEFVLNCFIEDACHQEGANATRVLARLYYLHALLRSP